MDSRRFALALLLGALVLTLIGVTGSPCDIPAPAERVNDIDVLYHVIADMRAGQGYYPAMSSTLREFGYCLRPLPAFRLPLLTTVGSLVPEPIIRVFLVALACCVAAAWTWETRRAGRLVTVIAGALLLFPVAMSAYASWAWLMPDLWIGLLIALALWWYPRNRIGTFVCAALALAIREHAVVFVLTMGMMALWEKRYRQAGIWGAFVCGFILYLAIHAHMVSGYVTPADRARQWVCFPGWPFVVSTVRWTWPGFFLFSFTRVNAVVPPLVLLGLFQYPGDLGKRMASTVLAYMCAFMFVGRADSWYWGLLYCPLLAIGLAYSIPALRQLLRCAFPSSAPTESDTHP